MAKVSSNQVMSEVDVTLAMPEWRLPDAASVAEDALAEGLKFCVQKMGLAGQQTAIGRLQQGDDTARGYCHYGIARHLDSLVEALDRALVQHYADLIGQHQLAHLLDVQVIDDADVKNRVGYGAMLSSLYQRPIQVWKR
jgi:hypothetical protein